MVLSANVWEDILSWTTYKALFLAVSTECRIDGFTNLQNRTVGRAFEGVHIPTFLLTARIGIFLGKLIELYSMSFLSTANLVWYPIMR